MEARIRRGDFPSGLLPSVRTLMQEYDAGRDTVLRGLSILTAKELIFSVPKRGYYVTRDA